MDAMVPTPNDPTPFTPQGAVEADKSLLVKFYLKPRADKAATSLHGRPVFKDVEYIDIRVPGSRNGAARPATDRDKMRFAEHYRMFKERIEAPLEGTPLVEWPPISRSQVEQLAFLHVKTVEQLAAVADSHVGQIMGLGNLKRLAQEFLSAAEADAPLSQLHAELEERDQRLAAQDATIQRLTARLDALERDTTPEPAPDVVGGPFGEDVAPGMPAGEPVAPIGGYRSVLDGAAEAEAELPTPTPKPKPTAGRRRRRDT